MIEDTRNVPDALSLLRCAQQQVVILRTIEFAAEARARKLTPYHHKMAQVIIGAEIFRRPVWFQHRRGKASIDYFIFIGINNVHSLIFLQELRDAKKRVWLEQIIMIKQPDPFASSILEAGVQRRRNAAVLSFHHDFDSRIACSELRQRHLGLI